MTAEEFIPSATAARILRAKASEIESWIQEEEIDPVATLDDLAATVALLSEIVAHLLDLHPEDPS